MLFLLFFSGLTGFSRSCIRAAVMLSLLFLGRMLMRHPDAKNSLGLAVFLLALPNPFAGADPGLLLSASATLGILELAGPLQSLRSPLFSRLPYPIRRSMERVLPPLELSVAAGIFTLPVLVLTFGGISLAAPLTNLLVSPSASLSILLTGIGSLCHSLPVLRLLSRWCFFLSGLSIRYLLAVCRFFSRRRFSYVDLSGRWFLFALALVLLLLAGAILLSYGAESDRELRLSAGLLSGILLLTSVFSWQLLHRNEVSVDFPAVGNGTCAVVCYDGHRLRRGLPDRRRCIGYPGAAARCLRYGGAGSAGGIDRVRCTAGSDGSSASGPDFWSQTALRSGGHSFSGSVCLLQKTVRAADGAGNANSNLLSARTGRSRGRSRLRPRSDSAAERPADCGLGRGGAHPAGRRHSDGTLRHLCPVPEREVSNPAERFAKWGGIAKMDPNN